MKQVIKRFFVIILAIWLYIEELVWDILQLPLKKLQRWLSTLPRYVALSLFVVPLVTMLPFKIFGLWLIANSHVVYGGFVFIVAKIIGTTMLATIFTNCKPALLTINLVNKGYQLYLQFHNWIHVRLEQYGVLKVLADIKIEIKIIRSIIHQWIAGGLS